MGKLKLEATGNKPSSKKPGENSSIKISNNVAVVRYGECQRNHAAKIGGYAVDGCREFMPSNEEQRSGAALTCAACGCHRNFHLKLDPIMDHMSGRTIDSSSSGYSSTASNGM